jgi:hypothetical protein
MDPKRAERRLGAIMFTDIVGYTALMAGNEVRASQLAQVDKAQTALRELLRLQPDLSVTQLKTFFGIAKPDFLDRLIEGLRKAGWETKD